MDRRTFIASFCFVSIGLISVATYADRDYSERLRYRNATVKGQILMGMTPKEVKRAWGRPTEINASGGKYGSSEQWVYDRPSGREYIYLDDGEVVYRN